MNSKQSKPISEVQLPFDFEEQKFDVADYLPKLKQVTLELVEGSPKGYGLDHDYVRDKFCRKAKLSLGLNEHPTKEELDYCFPDYDHTKYIERCSGNNQKPAEPKPTKPKPTSPPTSEQAEERLKNATKSEPEEKPEISEEDWQWIEKVNHDLGGRLRYASGFTPQTLALDIKFNLSNHRTRLYIYATPTLCKKFRGVQFFHNPVVG